MKREHRIFFALPFDSATRAMYGRVTEAVRKRFPTVTTVIGTQEVGPSPRYSRIASFKAQNRDLVGQFVQQIRQADVVVADLTHNNPNVHVELGIALTENKNILRVTGRAVTELGFDIRNLEVRGYRDEGMLTKSIIEYLRTFFGIKGLSLSPKHGNLYRQLATPALLLGRGREFDLSPFTPAPYILRDGAIRVAFELHAARSSEDWFGVYFRAGENPLLGSHLIYCRQNGAVEVAVYPGPRVVSVFPGNGPVPGRRTLLIEFENDALQVRIGRERYSFGELSHQTAGSICLATWRAEATVHSAEAISRDTIDLA